MWERPHKAAEGHETQGSQPGLGWGYGQALWTTKQGHRQGFRDQPDKGELGAVSGWLCQASQGLRTGRKSQVQGCFPGGSCT